MEIIMKNVESLIPYANNPRKNDDAVDMVASSIKNFGFKVPIVVDSMGEIVNGHTRLKAAKKLGLKEVPCIVADDLTDEQIRAFRLVDNKVSELSEWDEELLKVEMASIPDIDMEQFGFDDVDELIGDDEDIEEDDFEVELPSEPKTKVGDIYILGRHRLMCGDATDEESVKRLTGESSVDLLVTDPPYNVDYVGKTKDSLTIKNDKMDDGLFREFLKNSLSAADSVMKPGAVFYIWHADSEGYNFRGACQDVGWPVRQCLIWNKNSMVMGRQDYHWKHEPCLYGWKPGAGHLWASDRKQTTILNFDRPNRNLEHPTMKPIALFDYQIKK